MYALAGIPFAGGGYLFHWHIETFFAAWTNNFCRQGHGNNPSGILEYFQEASTVFSAYRMEVAPTQYSRCSRNAHTAFPWLLSNWLIASGNSALKCGWSVASSMSTFTPP